MSDLLSVDVIVAFITFVVGPIALVLIGNKRSKTTAKEVVQKEKNGGRGVAASLESILAWAADQTGKSAAKVEALELDLRSLKERVGELELMVALLEQRNEVLAMQVIQLGGQPFQAKP